MIAVTGANGLLGSYIVRMLLKNSLPFVALKRKGSDVSLLDDVSLYITWRDADVTDYESLLESLYDCSGVIHAAAVVSYHQRDKDTMFLVNVEGTKHVVNACLHLGISRLLHVSSVATLGKIQSQIIIDEQSKWIDGVSVSNYAETKYKAELQVWRGHEEGLSTVMVNPSVILAPTDWQKSSAQLFKYVWDERPFYTEGMLNVVDVRDVAEVIVRLYSSTIEAERFIVSGTQLSYKVFFTTIAKHFEKRPPHIKVGKSLLRFASIVEFMRASITGSSPLVTKETVQLVGKNYLYNNQKIKNALGLDFQPVDSSIEWCCQEYKKKILLKK